MSKWTNDDMMPFGKYKGLALSEVKLEYLQWLTKQDWIDKWPKLKEYILSKNGGSEKNETKEGLVCYYCGECGFDMFSFKDHLTNYCDEYKQIPCGEIPF